MAKQVIEMEEVDICSCRIWLAELVKHTRDANARGGVVKMPIPTLREYKALCDLAIAMADAKDVA